MHPLRRNIGSALPGFFELKGTFDKVSLSGRHRTFSFALAIEFLEVTFGEFGFGIESVDVGRTSFHHEEDTTLRLGWMVDRL